MSKPSVSNVLSESLPMLAAIGIGSALGLTSCVITALNHPEYRLFDLKDPSALMVFVLSAVLGIILYDVALHRLIFRPMCRFIKRAIITPWKNRRASAAKESSVWSRICG